MKQEQLESYHITDIIYRPYSEVDVSCDKYTSRYGGCGASDDDMCISNALARMFVIAISDEFYEAITADYRSDVSIVSLADTLIDYAEDELSNPEYQLIPMIEHLTGVQDQLHEELLAELGERDYLTVVVPTRSVLGKLESLYKYLDSDTIANALAPHDKCIELDELDDILDIFYSPLITDDNVVEALLTLVIMLASLEGDHTYLNIAYYAMAHYTLDVL